VTCLVGECSDYSWKDAAVDFGVGGFSWGVSNLSKLRYLKQVPKLAAAVRVAGQFGLGVAGEVTRRELEGEAYTLGELAWGSAVTTAIGEAGELGARGVGLLGRWAASRLAASDSAVGQFLAQDVGELFRGGGRVGAVEAVEALAPRFRIARRAQGSVWELGPWPRGLAIEDIVEAAGFRSGRLPKGFPGVDFFDKSVGVVTSLKSIDLRAPTYQNPANLERVLKGYVDKLVEFSGVTRATRDISLSEIRGRALDIAIPPGPMTPAQRRVLKSVRQYASARNVALTFITVE